MNRRNFLKISGLAGLFPFVSPYITTTSSPPKENNKFKFGLPSLDACVKGTPRLVLVLGQISEGKTAFANTIFNNNSNRDELHSTYYLEDYWTIPSSVNDVVIVRKGQNQNFSLPPDFFCTETQYLQVITLLKRFQLLSYQSHQHDLTTIVTCRTNRKLYKFGKENVDTIGTTNLLYYYADVILSLENNVIKIKKNRFGPMRNIKFDFCGVELPSGYRLCDKHAIVSDLGLKEQYPYSWRCT